MPVYEYDCPTCERVYEVHQGINDQPLTSCSVCGGEVKKIMSMSSFHLKGGGWYSDGYASGSSTSSEAKEETKAAKKTGKNTEKKSSDTGVTKKTPSCSTTSTDSSCKGCPASS